MKSLHPKSTASFDLFKDGANKLDTGGLAIRTARSAEICEKALDSIENRGFLLWQFLVRGFGGTKTGKLIHKSAYQILTILLAFGVILAYVISLRLFRMS